MNAERQLQDSLSVSCKFLGKWLSKTLTQHKSQMISDKEIANRVPSTFNHMCNAIGGVSTMTLTVAVIIPNSSWFMLAIQWCEYKIILYLADHLATGLYSHPI